MLEQGKWKDGAPVPSKEFHDRFEESLKLIEKKVGEKAPAGAEIIRMNRKTKRRGRHLKKAVVGCTTAAAAMAVFIGACYQNREPSVKRLAALQLPCLRVIAAARPCTFPLS